MDFFTALKPVVVNVSTMLLCDLDFNDPHLPSDNVMGSLTKFGFYRQEKWQCSTEDDAAVVLAKCKQ